MSTIVETSATLGDVFLKGITAELHDIKAQVDMDYSLANQGALGIENNDGTALFKTVNSTDARLTISGISQIGDMQATAEGENYKSDSRIATYETQVDWQKYTTGITITEEDRDDRIVSSKLNEARYLLISGKRTMNKHMFGLFNQAFTAQSSLSDYLGFYGDGVPFASTVHPIKGTGGTQSNASATSIPLSETNLETARIALMEQKGDKAGELTTIGGSNLILVVPTALEKLATVITKSTKRSNTANNDINVYDGMMTVMSSKLLGTAGGGSDSQWFLVDSMFSPAKLGVRKPLTIGAPYVNDQNKNITVDVSARYKVYNDDFRGFWASKGTGAAYSS